MRLTIEALGHTLTLALEQQDKEPEPDHPRGDVFATTERVEALDFDRTPIGFAAFNKHT